MKVLVIGLGSMGRRRIRNLKALGACDIFGFDTNKKNAAEAKKLFGITLLNELKSVGTHNFDLAVISTPPGAHHMPAKLCAANKIPFFVEFNLITKESLAIEKLARKNNVRWFASDTELFDTDILKLKILIDKKFEGYFVFQLGQNIHDWHPWQKLGEHFIFRPATNGMREMLRVELPWMLRMFGKVKKVAASRARFHTKKYAIDDFLLVELTFKSGARGVIVLDLISPEVVKRLDIIGKDKSITWHERESRFEVRNAGTTAVRTKLVHKKASKGYKFHEDAHLAEMRHVLNVVRSKHKSALTFEKEVEVLRLIDEIERISRR